MRIVKWTIAFLCGLLLLGLFYQRWAEHRDSVQFLSQGRMIPAGDHRLYLSCAGRGGPTVLFLSGDGTPSVTILAAQSRIARFTTTCRYDRAGLGWSDPAPRPMGLADHVHDLQQIVRNGRLATPLLLVPESGGNVVALSFFDHDPTSVAAMVMVDGSEPDLWFRGSPDDFASMRLMNPVWQAAWHVGAIRLLLPYLVPDWVERLPPRLRGEFDAVWSRPMPGYVRDTIDRWERTPVTGRPKIVAGALGSRPLTIIRHGRPGGMGVPEKYEAEWPAAQAKLATLSTASEEIVAKDNHHPIAEENPDLVSDQVARLVRKLRRQRR